MKKNHFFKTQATLLLLVSFLALIAFGCEAQQDPGCGSNSGSKPVNKVCKESVSVDKTAGAMLYYPCGISRPAAATTLTGGTGGTWESVEWLSNEIAAAGYVVVSFTAMNYVNGLVPKWTNGHLSAIDKIKALNSSHSILRGKIRTNAIQVAGHSKGGGGALDAAIKRGSEVASVVGMAPYSKLFGTGQEEYPVAQLSTVRAAVLIQSGGDKDKNSPPYVTREQYDALPDDISKAYHRFDSFGHMTWAKPGSDAQHARLARDIIAWMKYYLDHDSSQASYINDPSLKGVNIWQK